MARKPMSPEQKAKISASLKNTLASEGQRLKKSNIMKKVWQNPEYRQKITDATQNSWNTGKFDQVSSFIKDLWQDDDYRLRITQSCKEAWSDQAKRSELSNKLQELWTQPEFRLQFRDKWASDLFKETCRTSAKDAWKNSDYRKQHSEHYKTYWTEENRLKASIRQKEVHSRLEVKEKMGKARSAMPRISSLQDTLYSILDDLEIKFFKEHKDKPADPECVIGPYSFDCVIPRLNRSTLLIECQGDYWHNLPKAIIKDAQKASYIANNFPGKYELKLIWEHEFKCRDKIVELLKYWTGSYETKLVEFGFNELSIRQCTGDDYKLLLSKYHYLPGLRGGVKYGAYLNDKLVAICLFSPLIRQNINTSTYDPNQCKELSRLCIHPKYQHKNLGSWFVSRCLKLLKRDYNIKYVISYCDTSFNHTGAVYKASNFKLDSIVPADYWYLSIDGWVMHKKTLYDHATKMGIKEADFASQHGYNKVFGKEKLRFVKEL